MTATSLADQGDELRRSYRHHLEQIRRDTRLSDDGKRSAVASLWLDYQAGVGAIREADTKARADETARLEARIFRPAGGSVNPTEQAARQMAYRDAVRHAEAIESDEAGTSAMRRALRSGDADLARAVLSVALDRGWVDTANHYLDGHPSTAADVERLWQLRRQDTDMRLVVQREMTAGTETRPPELAPFRDDQLPAAAEGAITADAAWGAPLSS